jgi:hypothetical protein
MIRKLDVCRVTGLLVKSCGLFLRVAYSIGRNISSPSGILLDSVCTMIQNHLEIKIHLKNIIETLVVAFF